METLAKNSQGDLPALLDMLTVAVTTLDAVGVENYRELYLYVVGTTANEMVRDLRVEDGHLIVGPPVDRLSYPVFIDADCQLSRRALQVVEVGAMMRIWKWSPETMSTYLGCSEAMLSTWIGRSAGVDVPILPRAVNERIKRLSIVDGIRSLSGILDQDTPRWLSTRRISFGRRTIEEILLGRDAADYSQLVMWGLNCRQDVPILH